MPTVIIKTKDGQTLTFPNAKLDIDKYNVARVTSVADGRVIGKIGGADLQTGYEVEKES